MALLLSFLIVSVQLVRLSPSSLLFPPLNHVLSPLLTAQQWTNTGTALSIYGGARCLDVTNGSTANGNKMQIWACTGGVNQQITYTTDHRLAWTGKGECLDLTDGSLTNGNQVRWVRTLLNGMTT
jgi:hypothetical protein